VGAGREGAGQPIAERLIARPPPTPSISNRVLKVETPPKYRHDIDHASPIEN